MFERVRLLSIVHLSVLVGAVLFTMFPSAAARNAVGEPPVAVASAVTLVPLELLTACQVFPSELCGAVNEGALQAIPEAPGLVT